MDGAEQAVPEGAGVLSWDAEGNPVSVVFSMDALREYDAKVRAEERQRIDGLIAARLAAPVGMKEYGNDALIALRAEIAAGSAVPVATPPADDGFELCEHGVIGAHTYGEDMEDQVAWRDCPGKRRPVATPERPTCELWHGDMAQPAPHTHVPAVATPTDPVDEVKCLGCGATIRARMSDRPASRTDLPVRLARDTLDGGWVAEFMPMPGVQSQGETIPDALRGLADALAEAVASIVAALDGPAEQDGQR